MPSRLMAVPAPVPVASTTAPQPKKTSNAVPYASAMYFFMPSIALLLCKRPTSTEDLYFARHVAAPSSPPSLACFAWPLLAVTAQPPGSEAPDAASRPTGARVAVNDGAGRRHILVAPPSYPAAVQQLPSRGSGHRLRQTHCPRQALAPLACHRSQRRRSLRRRVCRCGRSAVKATPLLLHESTITNNNTICSRLNSRAI